MKAVIDHSRTGWFDTMETRILPEPSPKLVLIAVIRGSSPREHACSLAILFRVFREQMIQLRVTNPS
jgi:hypothetical protein